ncbi:MAG: N-acetylmuramoyl-L-alanine amidase [Chitinophagales bacterium]
MNRISKRTSRVNMIFLRSFILVILAASISSFAYSNSEYQIKTIVLDAGHGGHDTGCRGAVSNEKDVTLAVVLKLGEMISKNYPNIKVIYTRKTDEFIELYERADIANRNNADLFISVHCNANKSHDPFGTETWLMGLKKSEGNLEVSKRENDVILLEDNYQQNYDGFDPNSPEGYIILSMNQNAHLNQSIDLASKVEDQFKQEGRTSRGVKQAGFLVLWRTTMPSILIETGFLTNRTEEKYLTSENGQNEIAKAVLNAITSYKYEVEGSESGVASDDSDQNNLTDSSNENVGAANNLHDTAQTISVSNPVVAQTKSVDDLIFRIQIAASSKPINLKDPKFSSFKDIRNDKSENGMNRYVVGNYSSYDDCVNQLAAIRKKGFKDAFIVGYKNGKRTSVNYSP